MGTNRTKIDAAWRIANELAEAVMGDIPRDQYSREEVRNTAGKIRRLIMSQAIHVRRTAKQKEKR